MIWTNGKQWVSLNKLMHVEIKESDGFMGAKYINVNTGAYGFTIKTPDCESFLKAWVKWVEQCGEVTRNDVQ